MSIRENIVTDNGRYSKNYMNPVIPEGYRHVPNTDWKTGFQIERIEDGSLLEFIPVGYLENNGTLDGENFNEAFGRRDFYKEGAEAIGEEAIYGTRSMLWNQFQSIMRDGGFYVTGPLSKGEDLKVVSVPRKRPITMVDFYRASKLASSFETDNGLGSHLIFGAEYDSLLKWQIESGKLTVDEILYGRNDDKKVDPRDILELGKVAEWTQERVTIKKENKAVVRGPSINADGSKNPLAWRLLMRRYLKMPFVGCRAVLYIP